MDGDCSHEIKRCSLLGKKPRQHIIAPGLVFVALAVADDKDKVIVFVIAKALGAGVAELIALGEALDEFAFLLIEPQNGGGGQIQIAGIGITVFVLIMVGSVGMSMAIMEKKEF